MKIVIAMDSFKGGLAAADACRSVAAGLLDVDPTVECVHKPMADGGEGTVAALLAARIHADLGRDILDLPGGGAAGGLGAGAAAFFNADLAPGIATIIAATGLREALANADWCLTGEGSFDSQSLDGKVVAGVAAAARQAGVPVVVIAGRVGIGPNEWREHGIHAALPTHAPDLPMAQVMGREAELLRTSAARWLRETTG